MKIEIEISDLDAAILRNDLLDVKDWVSKAVKGKIGRASCRERV